MLETPAHALSVSQRQRPSADEATAAQFVNGAPVCCQVAPESVELDRAVRRRDQLAAIC